VVKKALVAILLLVVVGGVVWFDLTDLLTLESLKEQQASLRSLQEAHPVGLALGYAGVYILVAGLSLPGAALLTLVGGALFGLLWGTVLVSFASTLGATLAFLVGRFLFRDAVERRFGGAMRALNEGIRKEGPFYLFLVRLVPVFPFFVVNLAMALTPMRVIPFYWVSQLGMLPGTAVYVNAGTQLASLESLAGILSPQLLLAFALLGVFPLLASRLARVVARRRVLKGWTRPKRFDRNLVVIGAGAAGLVTAYIAAAVRARVTLIERDAMGGDCLNTGCVPSKSLLRTGRFMADVRRHGALGVAEASARVTIPEVMARVQGVVAAIAPHDSVERYEGLGVEVRTGEARITSPWTVEVGGETLTTRAIVVASGAEPVVPAIPGLDQLPYLTSETVWGLDRDPGHLLVLGGGAIGCELAQAFRRLGVRVTLVEMAPRLLAGEDPEVGTLLGAVLEEEGVAVLTQHKVVAFEPRGEGGGVAELVPAPGAPGEIHPQALAFDTVLLAVGRKARVEGFGLESVGVRLTPEGRIETDPYLETRVPSIYAAGDCVGPHLYTHAASYQAWVAAVNALFRNPFKRFRVDYRFLPRTLYTEPEVARVGMSEGEAQEQGIPHEVTLHPLEGLDRALADGTARGFVKILTVPGRDRILGATVVGPHAGELVALVTLAMKHGIGMNGILGTIHAYPTYGEALKAAAGRWKRERAPQRVLAWVARYHRWRLG
jgi:pyruvate/2-oxoglutarate dehydrogenase complex dihydrolipoamide dehydrogenase (E3) component/uncharacterized membrane protein YdjX (TVP38/TMEM64 family)